jgi:hypothetical protein
MPGETTEKHLKQVFNWFVSGGIAIHELSRENPKVCEMKW